jgi:hypothetical protein
MMSMASDVGRAPLIALRSIGHAERTTAQSIAAVNVTASPGRLTAGIQLSSPSLPTGMFMNTFTGWRMTLGLVAGFGPKWPAPEAFATATHPVR